ncbi:MAG: hypothetical protein HC905_09975 [Bacteroidales bacterium]|nr:hypothetical protein [Bacteroidales bacterium]
MREKPDSYKIETLLHSYIWKIEQDGSGNIWVATDGEGVLRFSNHNGEVLAVKAKRK